MTEQKSMTALVSAFSRWYHAEHNETTIFNDSAAGSILSDDEKRQIAENMHNFAGFFDPSLQGSPQALRRIVDNQLSPSPLGRAAWAEKALETAVKTGTAQYIVVAAGYDTFAYRQPAWARGLRIIELDTQFMLDDKRSRVKRFMEEKPYNLTYLPIDLAAESFASKLRACAEYDKSKVSFYSMLGITYYLTKASFTALLKETAEASPDGSAVAFDYPDQHTCTEFAGERAKKQVMMTHGTNEAMLASYSYEELEALLSECGFLIYEHLTPDEITSQYFRSYNAANPRHPMTAFDNVNYCLAVKKRHN